MMRRQPFSELMTLRDAMDRLFEESFVSAGRMPCLTPALVPIDMYRQDSNLVVKASLPGAKLDEIDVALTGESVTIKGEIKREAEAKEENAIRRERCYGTFSRALALPNKMDSNKVSATFENGVLTAEEAKAKEIKVQAK